MSTAVETKKFTIEEYLEMEYSSDIRHYFYNGIIEPMPYTSENHGLIVANLIGELHAAIKGTEFRVYPSDRMLYVPDCNLNYYPDVMIVKGPSQFHQHSEKMQATINPHTLIEVLSDSTEQKDKIDKWRCYRQIPSLQQYIKVAQDPIYIDILSRIPGSTKWENDYISNLEQSVNIAGFDIKAKDIYHFVHPAKEKEEKSE